MKINPYYKLMVDSSIDFQKHFKDKAKDGQTWNPRLISLVEIAESITTATNKQALVFKTAVRVFNHTNTQIDQCDMVVDEFCQEQMYLSYIMWNMFDLKWNRLISQWINKNHGVIHHCIENQINLYCICTDPEESANIFKKGISLCLDDFLTKDLPTENGELDFRWFICNLSLISNQKLYEYEPFHKRWNKIN